MSEYKRLSPLRASQNFLTASRTIKKIVGLAEFSGSDHVLEIGPGKGHITRRLCELCGAVTAVELDRRLFSELGEKLKSAENLRLIHGDFLKTPLPRGEYKVFSNIPFGATSEIIRKLTGSNPPSEAWLVVEKGAAKRFAGLPRESRDSLLLKPFFELEIRWHFRREDFHPAPSADPVLLHITKKTVPDIPLDRRAAYADFIAAGFARKEKGVCEFITKRQAGIALKKAGLPPLGAEMLYVQWLCLFRCSEDYGQGRARPDPPRRHGAVKGQRAKPRSRRRR